MNKELDTVAHSKITALCESGDNLAAEAKFQDALKQYCQAWQLLPDPKFDWEAALWIQSAIGDAHYLMGNYAQALDAFAAAIQSPGGVGNPFVHLRLGECHYELGHISEADDELTRAYMGGGKELFENENSKFLDRLRGVLKLPDGQQDL